MESQFNIKPATRTSGGMTYTTPSSTSLKGGLWGAIMKAKNKQAKQSQSAPAAEQKNSWPNIRKGINPYVVGAVKGSFFGNNGNRQAPTTEPKVPYGKNPDGSSMNPNYGQGRYPRDTETNANLVDPWAAGVDTSGGYGGDPWATGGGFSTDSSSSSSGSMMGTPLTIPSPFGDKYQTYEELLGLRNNLSRLRNQSEIGETISNEELVALTGMDAFDPNQMDSIERAKADNFNAPISYIDALLDREARMAENQSKASASSFGNYDLNSKQQTLLNGVINNYSKDNIIQQGQNALQINNVLNAVEANPNAAGNQLIALYTLVKNLDPDSAVREGELALAEKTQSYLGAFGNTLARIKEGRIVAPAAMKQLTDATRLLANEWVGSSQRRQQQYRSNAQVFGLEEPFNDYIGGFTNPDMIDIEGGQGGNSNQGGGGVFAEQW